MKILSDNALWNILRICMSFIVLWAFFDKLLGLGFATSSDHSWLNGVSPTAGFLKFGTHGILSPLFHNLSGNMIVDILFMAGLFLVGTCLLLGIGLKMACYSGAFMMFLIYLSLLPPENNPIIDEHIVYILIFLLLLNISNTQNFGFSKKWRKMQLVKRYPILQ